MLEDDEELKLDIELRLLLLLDESRLEDDELESIEELELDELLLDSDELDDEEVDSEDNVEEEDDEIDRLDEELSSQTNVAISGCNTGVPSQSTVPLNPEPFLSFRVIVPTKP
jgi:hypothetical protein